MAPILKKEGARIKSIKIVANTPAEGQLVSINSLVDILKIENKTWDFAAWLKDTNFQENNLF
jgi:hypothetical protein